MALPAALVVCALARGAHALDGFDFAVERLQVTGNGAFDDSFDDGDRAGPPTSLLFDLGATRVTEGGGRLLLREDDGADRMRPPAAQTFRDWVRSRRPITDGAGSATITATFGGDVPSGRDEGYGVFAVDGTFGVGSTLGIFLGVFASEAIAPALVPIACRSSGDLVVLFQNQGFGVLGCDVVSPAAVGAQVVLRLALDDAANSVVPSYSLDGGTSFVAAGSWTVAPAPEPVFAARTVVFPGLFGQGEVGFLYALGSTPMDLAYAGSDLLAQGGELHRLDGFGGVPLDAGAVGSATLAASGPSDLRLAPGTATLTPADGVLTAVAVKGAEPRRVDVGSARPLEAGAAADATCPTGAEPACLAPGEATPGSDETFDALCDLSRGFFLGDPARCALDIFGSQYQPLAGTSLANAFSLVLAGGPAAEILLAVLLGTPLDLPFATLSGGLPGGSGFTDNVSAQQQAAFGCGPFYGVACSTAGISLRRAEASALFEAWPPASALGQPGFDATDANVPQPGTIGAASGDTCARRSGGILVRLPGCRGAADPGYDPMVDGETNLLHPLTGQTFRTELAAASWNLLVFFIVTSADWDGLPVATASTTSCSFRAPQFCAQVRGLLANIAVAMADDPNGPPALRFVWNLGADALVTAASGGLAPFAGGRLQLLGPVASSTPPFVAGAGFLLVPPAFADADGDGVRDDADACRHASDPDQLDTGGVGSGSAPDGIGDACQCGDVSGDGRVTLADAVLLTRSLLQPPTAVLARPDLCDVGGPPSPGTQGCTLSRAVTLRRALLSPPTAQIQQACAPAQP